MLEQVVVGVGYVSIALAVLWGMMAVTVFMGQATGVEESPEMEVMAAERVLTLSIHPTLPTIVTMTADPWELTAADLVPQRVLYNVLTKAGFRIMFVQILLGVVLVSLAMAISHRWLGVQAVKQAREAMVGTAPEKQIVIEIAGTIKIAAKMGVIYEGVKALTGGESGEREYAFCIGGFELIGVARAR
jgi:hypothetical protein